MTRVLKFDKSKVLDFCNNESVVFADIQRIQDVRDIYLEIQSNRCELINVLQMANSRLHECYNVLQDANALTEINDLHGGSVDEIYLNFHKRMFKKYIEMDYDVNEFTDSYLLLEMLLGLYSNLPIRDVGESRYVYANLTKLLGW